MGKVGFQVGDAFRPFSHDGKQFWRKRHNATNAHNLERQACIKRGMEGKHFANQKEVHQALGQLSRSCK